MRQAGAAEPGGHGDDGHRGAAAGHRPVVACRRGGRAARPTISSGALAGYSPQTGWLAPAWYSGAMTAYAATQATSMTLSQARFARWAGPLMPAPARLITQALQPILMAASAKATATAQPLGGPV